MTSPTTSSPPQPQPQSQSPSPSSLLDPTLEANLKSTLWYQIGRLVDDETINLGINATPQYIGSLSELVWAQLVSAAGDIEAFARHRTAAKRGGRGAGQSDNKTCTIKVKDVLLLGRRNEGLMGILLEEVNRLSELREKEKEKEQEKNKDKDREKSTDKAKGKGKERTFRDNK